MKGIGIKRKAANLSQDELARFVGVTQGAVSQWESGESMPRAEMLLKIAEVLNCTTDDLLRPIDVG